MCPECQQDSAVSPARFQAQRPALPTWSRTPQPRLGKGARIHFLLEGSRSFNFPNEKKKGAVTHWNVFPSLMSLMSCLNHPWLTLPRDLLGSKASLSFRKGALGCLQGFHLQRPHGCQAQT